MRGKKILHNFFEDSNLLKVTEQKTEDTFEVTPFRKVVSN